MSGFSSQFAEQGLAAVLTAICSLFVAGVLAVRRHRRDLPWMSSASRVLAIGAAVVVLIGTAVPFERVSAYERKGAFVPVLGRGGLGEWRVLLDDPNSLAAVLLIANVAVFLPVAFFTTLGWRCRFPWVVAACLALACLVETLQYLFIGRTAATDDVLLYMVGALAGWVAAQPLAPRAKGARPGPKAAESISEDLGDPRRSLSLGDHMTKPQVGDEL